MQLKSPLPVLGNTKTAMAGKERPVLMMFTPGLSEELKK
jgi:hypothetical protein